MTLPDGSVKLSTKFTRLTGRSPILLAGMTPTTVDAKIVAAAANAGHWAELAGGGQVTEEIFDDRIAELTELLEPGRAVQFNSLFLDPYLWKLQVGGKRLVQKARQSGAPIDGVVVSAGIPDLEEAVELIDELNERRHQPRGVQAGHHRPDQVGHQDRGRGARQGRSSCTSRAAAPAATTPGRTSTTCCWPPTPTCASCPTSPSASAAASAPRSGPPSTCPVAGPQAYGFPPMPVDGILVGTAAMATLEATTSPSVKQMLVETTGTDHWISAGKAQGGMASSRSQLGADIHEIDNAASRCGRLLDEVAGDAEAVADRRDEIIAAMANTAKPYFGDVGEMTYLQWLQRYVELAIGDGDSTADTALPGSPWLADTWRDRFDEMLKRAEARLHPQDSGPIETLFNDEALLENPEQAIAALLAPLPRRRRPSSCTRPTCRSSSRCARRWASRSTSCRSSTRTCGAGGAATRCGRPTTPATPPTRCASFPGTAVGGRHHPRRRAGRRTAGPLRAGRDRRGAGDGRAARRRWSRRRQARADVTGPLAVVLDSPDVLWAGRTAINPVHRIGAPDEWQVNENRSATHPSTGARLELSGDDAVTLSVPLSDIWIDIRFTLPSCTVDGGMPVVTVEDASTAMRSVLAIAAGVDGPDALPPVHDNTAKVTVDWDPEQVADHTGVTATFGAPLAPGLTLVPDALVGLLLARGVRGHRLGRHRRRLPRRRGPAEPGASGPRRAPADARCRRTQGRIDRHRNGFGGHRHRVRPRRPGLRDHRRRRRHRAGHAGGAVRDPRPHRCGRAHRSAARRRGDDRQRDRHAAASSPRRHRHRADRHERVRGGLR